MVTPTCATAQEKIAAYGSLAFIEGLPARSGSWMTFLCHSSKGKGFVQRLADDLRHIGVRVRLVNGNSNQGLR